MDKDKKRQITKKEKAIVFELYEGRCNICDIKFEEGDYVEYDHIIPHAIGGKSDISNIQPICFDCKNIKNPKDTSKIAKTKKYIKKKSEEFEPTIKSDRKLTSSSNGFSKLSGFDKLLPYDKGKSNTFSGGGKFQKSDNKLKSTKKFLSDESNKMTGGKKFR